MIRSVGDVASWLAFKEAAEVDPILYMKGLDSQSQWEVLYVQLRISPEGLILCWGVWQVPSCILWGFMFQIRVPNFCAA